MLHSDVTVSETLESPRASATRPKAIEWILSSRRLPSLSFSLCDRETKRDRTILAERRVRDPYHGILLLQRQWGKCARHTCKLPFRRAAAPGTRDRSRGSVRVRRIPVARAPPSGGWRTLCRPSRLGSPGQRASLSDRWYVRISFLADRYVRSRAYERTHTHAVRGLHDWHPIICQGFLGRRRSRAHLVRIPQARQAGHVSKGLGDGRWGYLDLPAPRGLGWACRTSSCLVLACVCFRDGACLWGKGDGR